MASRDTDQRGWPSAASPVVGIIGDPVAHSLTPLLHNSAFRALGLDWVSVGFQVPAGGAIGALGAMRALGLRGLSVTMPHKSDVTTLVDELTSVAATLGAVNSIYWRDDRLIGDNTDGAGLLASLRRSAAFEPAGKRCMVVGAGGAARAVVLALADAGADEIVVVNRSARRAEEAATLAGSAGRVGDASTANEMDLVIQATPVGMADTQSQSDAPLVDPRLLRSGQVVADLIYHPLTTPWLATAAQQGATTVGGLGMLVHQAQEALRTWTGLEPPVEAMWAAASAAVGA